jgi:hypothetical protein
MKNFDLKNNFARDWKILVLVFAIVLISLSLFAWKIYLSDSIAGGYLAPVIEPSDTITKIVDKKRLEADILLLETKQAEYLKLKANQPRMVDPSL